MNGGVTPNRPGIWLLVVMTIMAGPGAAAAITEFVGRLVFFES
jgi:hypothetical protein